MDSRASIVIDYLYDEGRRDIILFGYILGLVTSDGENLYQKTPEQRFSDATTLSNFLVSSGAFVAGKTTNDSNGEFKQYIFEDFEDFIVLNKSNFEKGGIDDIDLITQTWLKKVTKKDIPEIIPEFIEKLFE
ncbi:hypothetical protein JNB71_19035 [Rhizobium herbae]|uniref:Uncharacterized protein n=1 Tax=Rhizobium herbae TaxID=508661 RepID=A0ABS7HFR6_9HYPH|nr:hypothetical protein [Rhizobium herbae]MBW9065402.1 hypothetical protein [Rhizobium herbae]